MGYKERKAANPEAYLAKARENTRRQRSKAMAADPDGYRAMMNDAGRKFRARRMAEDPVKWRRIGRDSAQKSVMRRKYGMSLEDFRQMFEGQEGLCGICSKHLCLSCGHNRCRQKAHIDHDHATGKVRGILCASCNIGLGHFDDSRSALGNAVGWVS